MPNGLHGTVSIKIVQRCQVTKCGIYTTGIYLADAAMGMILIGLYLARTFLIIRQADTNAHKLPDDIIV